MTLFDKIKQRLKKQDTPMMRLGFRMAKAMLTVDIPPIPLVHAPLRLVLSGCGVLTDYLIRAVYWKPAFLLSVSNRPKRLLMFGKGRPFIDGPLSITMGDDCRLSAQVNFTGRSSPLRQPELVIGNNVGIGWSQGIYVGDRIVLGDNVRIGGQGCLSGFSGHPLDAAARARGEPDREDQVRSIILEDDVWLGRFVIVNAGVTIGKGTIVAAGSVVTKDLPPGVIAGGNPARVIRTLDHDQKITSWDEAVRYA